MTAFRTGTGIARTDAPSDPLSRERAARDAMIRDSREAHRTPVTNVDDDAVSPAFTGERAEERARQAMHEDSRNAHRRRGDR